MTEQAAEAASGQASVWRFGTRAVHTGERAPKPDFTPVSTPIYSTVGYMLDTMEQVDAVFGGEREGFVYTRYGNPTVAALEQAVATLELGDGAVAFGSGMAALHAALLATGLKQGDRVVASRDIYGATFSLLSTLMPTLGIETTFVDGNDLAQVEAAVLEKNPRVVLVETITNPLMFVSDIPRIVEIGHRVQAYVLVDNTFASPFLLQPRAHGADIVVHSTTKYLGGHGDVTGGIVVGAEPVLSNLSSLIKLTGGILGPFEAWITLRGIKTLALRVERQCENALKVARWLSAHPRVAKVNYPGLEEHPQHALAASLLRPGRFGGMISFELAGGDRESVMRFMDALRLCLPVTTLGDVYTELLYPAISSHRALSPAQRAAFGIGEGLVRISVGIEDAEDIIADLGQALAASRAG
ncbi:MAG: PLP-dependent aspartate aminotransferase family protein [Bacteroidetes bacterium]|nr:PLP-dependent aspartate aminotransferase family protein [Bacteroidota bacterium]MCL5025488.1 PLP-dependent aspartate aminotransferase family protein [Chloroflexota bacterium]